MTECGVDCGCKDTDPCPFEEHPHGGMSAVAVSADVLNTCHACSGSGVYEDFDGIDQPCSRCRGRGYLVEEVEDLRGWKELLEAEVNRLRAKVARVESALDDPLNHADWCDLIGHGDCCQGECNCHIATVRAAMEVTP